MGYSQIVPGAPYDEPAMRDAVRRLLTQLDLRDVTLLGESMGAVLALTAAADLPDRVRRVVAVNAYDYAGSPAACTATFPASSRPATATPRSPHPSTSSTGRRTGRGLQTGRPPESRPHLPALRGPLTRDRLTAVPGDGRGDGIGDNSDSGRSRIP